MSDGSEFQVRGPQPKMPGERARFTFLGQSPAGRRMTTEDNTFQFLLNRLQHSANEQLVI